MGAAYVAALLTVVYAHRADRVATTTADNTLLAGHEPQFANSPSWADLAGYYHLPVPEATS